MNNLDQKYIRHSIIYAPPVQTPGTVIVDNNPGFITYTPLPSGYKNFSLKYSNIHEAMGINFYANNESIGACIFKENILISVTDLSIPTFFTISPDEAEVSLISATQIDENTIYIAAILNAGDSIVFSSKTASYPGLIMSIPTTVEHVTTTERERELHRESYEESGEFTGTVPEEDYYTYESYNGSHGFSDVAVVELDIDSSDSEAMIKIYKRILTDIKGLSEPFKEFPEKEYYSIESFYSNGTLFMIGLTTTELVIGTSIDNEEATYSTLSFEKETRQDEFSNVYSKRIAYVAPRDLSRTTGFKQTYTPSGIIKRYKSFDSIVFSRIEDVVIGGIQFNGLGLYELRLSKNENDKDIIDEDSLLNGGSTIMPANELKSNLQPEDMTYVFYSKYRILNGHVFDSDVAAKNKDCVHISSPQGTLSNQKTDIITVKSMSDFMMYTYIKE